MRKALLLILSVAALLLTLAALPYRNAGSAVPASAEVEPTGYIALTFDDGPWPGTTRELLDGLEQRGAKATFFLIGKQIDNRPELVLRMVDEGHQIGLHTWDHVQLSGLDRAGIEQQLDQCRHRLEDLVGESHFMLRPPYGFVDETLEQWAGAPIICWSVDTEDWKDEDVGRIIQSVLTEAKDGDIILMHDIFHSSVTAALACVDELLERGYSLVTVEELFALRGVVPEDGQVYHCFPPEAETDDG